MADERSRDAFNLAEDAKQQSQELQKQVEKVESRQLWLWMVLVSGFVLGAINLLLICLEKAFWGDEKMNIAWERLRDPKIWVLFFSFIKLLLAAVGIDIAPERWAEWEAVFNGACGIAVALGIFHYNPQADKGEKAQ